MFAIAVLFFLVVWLFITLFAMHIGSKILKKRMSKSYAGKLGGFLGFMLTMGGFMVYWIGEYAYIQYNVSQLCRAEGGIEEYVSVDDFKQRLATNNWAGVPTYTVLPKGDVENEEYILFQGKEFKGLSPDTSIPEIGLYLHRVLNKYPYSVYVEQLNIFNQEKVVLVKYTEVGTGTGGMVSLSGLKFWIDGIKDCSLSQKITYTRFLSYKEELKNAQ